MALEVLDELGAEALIVLGDRGSHADLLWLTGFAPNREAALLLPRSGEPVLLVNYFNHLPTARETAWIEDVAWGEDDAGAAAEREARRRGLTRVASNAEAARRLYARRLVRSSEELEVIRRAARLSDAAVGALREQAAPGMTDWDLLALVEAQWTPRGARTGIAYIGVNRPVPAQVPSGLAIASGDAVTVELSASVEGYWGQVLRTFTVGGGKLRSPHSELRELALEAFDAVRAALREGATAAGLEAAGGVIDRAGRTIVDDLAHLGGSAGTYRPSVRTPGSRLGPTPDFTYLAGMCVVVQPNVVDRDGRSGVQHGELLLVTGTGTERLHGLD